jgi:hypothetical protein
MFRAPRQFSIFSVSYPALILVAGGTGYIGSRTVVELRGMRR